MAALIQNKNTLVNAALCYATQRHGNQVRKGNDHIPYIFHPIDVANEVVYYSKLPHDDMECAKVLAILHDVVEDTDGTLQEVQTLFGPEFRYAVSCLSKDPSITEEDPNSKMNSLCENLERIKDAPKWVWCVKMADRVSNLKNFPAMWSREKIEQYLIESELIANELREASEGLYARLISRINTSANTLSIIYRS